MKLSDDAFESICYKCIVVTNGLLKLQSWTLAKLSLFFLGTFSLMAYHIVDWDLDERE